MLDNNLKQEIIKLINDAELERFIIFIEGVGDLFFIKYEGELFGIFPNDYNVVNKTEKDEKIDYFMSEIVGLS